MHDVSPLLDAVIDDDARAFLLQAREDLTGHGSQRLEVIWPVLARRVGRERLAGSRVTEGDARVDLGAWRACDAAGLILLGDAQATPEQLVDLYLHGDFEEKAIVLRSLAFLPVTDATVRLFDEMQRSNTAFHFEAGALDSNLAVRALSAGGEASGFTRDDFHRVVLKTAFLDLPTWRLFGALDEADTTLSGMLQGYATEREAAGRSTWLDTPRFLGRAPVPGTVARLLGGIEHGDDSTRLAAAEGLAALARPDLAAFARERLDREMRAAVRVELEKAAAV